MLSSKEINSKIQKNILNGSKIPHGVSRPLIYKEEDKYYLAVFVFFYTKEEFLMCSISRPTMWAILNIENGNIIEKYETSEKDFSNASYDIKYNISPDKEYNTSAEYYDKAFSILDSVREELIEKNRFNEDKYKEYFKMVLDNIPESYKRFFKELSV